jgi:hypothetical protein
VDVTLSEHSPRRVDDALTQIALAKQLALAGLVEAPEYIVSAPLSELSGLPDVPRRELEAHRGLVGGGYHVMFDSDALSQNTAGARARDRTRFMIKASAETLNDIVGERPLPEMIRRLDDRRAQRPWHTRSEDQTAEVTTPLGFTFRVEVERRRPVPSGAPASMAEHEG